MRSVPATNDFNNPSGWLAWMRFWPLLLIGAACFTTALMAWVPAQLIDWPAIQIASVAVLLMVVMVATLARNDRFAKPVAGIYRISLVLWWFLLVVEQFFPRRSTSYSTYAGQMAASAYGEAIIWVFIAAFLALLLLTHLEFLRGLFTGSFKWLSIFAVITVLSAPLSHSMSFSLAWAFKLSLCVVLLRVLLSTMRNTDDTRRFLRVNCWAFLLLALLAVGQAVTSSGGTFGFTTYDDVSANQSVNGQTSRHVDPDVRLNAIVHPVAVSEWGGLLLLLSMMLFSLERSRLFMVLAVLGAGIMVLAGGKAAIASGLLCAGLFFAFQKRLGTALGVAIGLSILALAVILGSPLSEHIKHYAMAGQASTLTGRTELWAVAIPEIKQKLLFGHGYMSSRWIAEQIETPWDAGHMHNGFLEVLYNNGLVGMIPILLIHALIIRNLLSVLKTRPNRDLLIMATGSLAIYVNFLLNGMVEVVWGGRPTSFFMLFLALLVISLFLRQLVNSESTDYIAPVRVRGGQP